MINPGTVIFARLNGATSAGARITPLLLPEEPTYPAVTYQQISMVPTHLMGSDAGVVRFTMQVDCWGKTYAEATTLANEVDVLLSRFRGNVAGIQVHDVLLDNSLHLYESDAQVRRCMLEFSMFLSE